MAVVPLRHYSRVAQGRRGDEEGRQRGGGGRRGEAGAKVVGLARDGRQGWRRGATAVPVRHSGSAECDARTGDKRGGGRRARLVLHSYSRWGPCRHGIGGICLLGLVWHGGPCCAACLATTNYHHHKNLSPFSPISTPTIVFSPLSPHTPMMGGSGRATGCGAVTVHGGASSSPSTASSSPACHWIRRWSHPPPTMPCPPPPPPATLDLGTASLDLAMALTEVTPFR